MYLPPVATATETWENDWRLGAAPRVNSSVAAIDNYYKSMRAQNWTALAYMCLTAFGRNMTSYMAGGWQADPDPQADWRNPPAYMRAHLDAAIPRDGHGNRFWIADCAGDCATTDCKCPAPLCPLAKQKCRCGTGGCLQTDPGVPVYKDFLVEQVRRHLHWLPNMKGVALDRATFYTNFAGDDNLSLTNTGRKVQSGVRSFLTAMDAIGPLLHDAGKVISYNTVSGSRVDLMEHVDQIFTEDNVCRGEEVNANSFLGLDKPVVLWTNSIYECVQLLPSFSPRTN